MQGNSNFKKIIRIGGLQFAKKFQISNCKASDGWVRNFIKRYKVGGSIFLHDEAGDVDMESAEQKMVEFR